MSPSLDTDMKPRFRFSRRVFRMLRPLYPREVRVGNEEELEALFVSSLERERERRGWVGLVSVWLGTVVDLMINRGAGWRNESGRPRHRWQSAEEAMRDLRHGIGMLRRQPLFALVIVVALGVGIGGTMAMATLVRGVLLRPLPFPESDNLIKVWSTNATQQLDREGVSPGDVLDFQERSRGLEGLAAWYMTSGTYQEPGYAEEVITAQVTGNFFEVLGAKAAVGRVFRTNDVQTAFGPIVISNDFWRRRLGADSSIVGRSIIVSGRSYTVIGVMPEDFAFPDRTVQHWLAWDMRVGYSYLPEVPRTWRFLQAIGRLAPNTTPIAAERELQGIARDLALEFAGSNAGWGVRVTSLFEETVGAVRAELLIGLLAVGLLLLLACVNVANMLLAKLPIRAKELVLRAALGASYGRLARQLLTETLAFVVVATAFGIALAAFLLRSLVTFNAGQIPRLESVGVDFTLAAFSVLIVTAVTMVSGLAPALALRTFAREVSPHRSRRGATTAQRRLRAGLVVAQLALAVALLVGAGLFGRSFALLNRFDLGYEGRNVLAFRLSLNSQRGGTGHVVPYYRAVLDSMAALPGVREVGAATTLPLDPVGNDFGRPYRLAGERTPSAEAAKAQIRIVTSGFFRALSIPTMAGTTFSGFESETPRVVVVNRTLARRHWGDLDAVGREIEIDFRDGWQSYTVIGVVGDVHHYGARRNAEAEVFLSHRQVPYLAMSVVVRSSSQPERLIPLIQAKLREVDAGQPAHHFTTLDAIREDAVAEDRLITLLFSTFASIALLLAATGVYGVVANEVTQRTHEVGVRLALGAHPTSLAFSVVRRAVALAVTGTAIGLILAWRLGDAVASLLYQVSPTDVRVMAGVGGILLIVAAVAALGPARRITRVDPVRALGFE